MGSNGPIFLYIGSTNYFYASVIIHLMSSLFIVQKKWKSILSLIVFIFVVAVNFVVISFGMRIKPIVNMVHKAQEIATDVRVRFL